MIAEVEVGQTEPLLTLLSRIAESAGQSIAIGLVPLPGTVRLPPPTRSKITSLGSSTQSGTWPEKIIYNTKNTGTYYVKVVSKSGAYSNQYCYTLLASQGQPSGKTCR